ncbi:MAG TPA: hypothetical protein VFK79_10725 [Xanthobacteraceae bacterium]|nr:hypothetical protein [Xanthobacteraceae bacterium]
MHPANEDSRKAALEWAASFHDACRRFREQAGIEPEPAPTPDEVVRQIRQKLAAKPRRWRGCPQRNCRRHHRCASSDLWCILTALSPEQQARTRAQIARALAGK